MRQKKLLFFVFKSDAALMFEIFEKCCPVKLWHSRFVDHRANCGNMYGESRKGRKQGQVVLRANASESGVRRLCVTGFL